MSDKTDIFLYAAADDGPLEFTRSAPRWAYEDPAGRRNELRMVRQLVRDWHGPDVKVRIVAKDCEDRVIVVRRGRLAKA